MRAPMLISRLIVHWSSTVSQVARAVQADHRHLINGDHDPGASRRQRHDHPDAGAVGQHRPPAVGLLVERRRDRLQRLRRRARERRRDVGEGRSWSSVWMVGRQHRPRRRGASRASAADGRSQRRLVGLAGDVPGVLAGRQRRDEELGVVAPGLDRRGDPVRERAQQVRAQGEARGRPAARPGTGRGSAARAAAPPSPRRTRPETTSAAVGDAGQQDAGLLERLAHGGADQLAGGPLVAAERLGPRGTAADRPRRPRCRRPAGRPRRRGRRSCRRRTACPRVRRSR